MDDLRSICCKACSVLTELLEVLDEELGVYRSELLQLQRELCKACG